MTKKADSDFKRLTTRRFNESWDTLIEKAKEYASDDNRFHNFDEAAKLNRTTPEQSLWGFLTKHIVSVQDMALSPDKVTQAMLDEKIGDCINYLVLLEGLLSRRIAQKNSDSLRGVKPTNVKKPTCVIIDDMDGVKK